MTTSRSPSRSPSIEAAALLSLLLVSAGAAAQSISNSSSLSFGAFAAGNGGTITVSTLGARSQSGGVVLASSGSSASAAQIIVSGTASASVAFTLPANGTVVLSDGSHTMALNNFVSNPSGSGILGGGTLMLAIGASLSVSPSQVPGNYTGSFDVTVDYN
ncbi:MAG: DUF4402 domain-containing protein [Paucibacter sp.]|nr:DUF4402 domain-containing protein [Roseateles sp.]